MDHDEGDLISVGESSTGSQKRSKKITKRKREQADRIEYTQMNYNKTYSTQKKEHWRFFVFRNTLRQIQAHNRKYKNKEIGFAVGITQFADLTQEEFANLLQSRPGNIDRSIRNFNAGGLTSPESFDWREIGAVSRVTDQGTCSSCWAIAACGAIEAQRFIHNGTLEPLSHQNLVDCSHSYGNNGCSGGEAEQAYDYVRDHGVMTDSDYPYVEDDQQCKQQGYITKVTGYFMVERDEDHIAKALANHGPISVSIDAGWLRIYRHGVFDNSIGCRTGENDTNHAVLLVGYGSEGGVDYWIAKNSWGPTWGEEGFFRLKKGENTCGVKKMKLLLVAVLVLVADALSVKEEWQQFKLDHGKTYRSLVEEKLRYSIFQDNVRKIKEHNEKYDKGAVSYAMKVTQFADMTEQEFLDLLKMQSKGLKSLNGEVFDSTGIEAADSLDWRKKGAVTEVGAMEGQIFLKNGSLDSLSSQNLVDCATNEYENAGCHGGMMDNAFRYVIKNGIETDKEYPYKAIDEKCRQKKHTHKFSKYLDIKPDEEDIAKALSAVGPISAAMEASTISFYSHGIVDSTTGCSNDFSDLNHGVLIVGYQTEGDDDYWIVKNSWGLKWGEKGYMKLRRNVNACGIKYVTSFPQL
nr:unnamed protein product [Callosobruchus chinensis]